MKGRTIKWKLSEASVCRVNIHPPFSALSVHCLTNESISASIEDQPHFTLTLKAKQSVNDTI